MWWVAKVDLYQDIGEYVDQYYFTHMTLQYKNASQ